MSYMLAGDTKEVCSETGSQWCPSLYLISCAVTPLTGNWHYLMDGSTGGNKMAIFED